MFLAVSCGCGWRYCATSILDVLTCVSKFGEQGAEAGLYERPGALVLGFLLQPLYLSIGIASQRWLNGLEGEGCELLEPHNSNIFDATLLSLSL